MAAPRQIDPDIRGKFDPDRAAIAALATRQHGIVARWQLLEIGFKSGAIDRRIASGLLHPLHRGAYAVGHRKVSAKGSTMAAVLAYGPMAVVSHRSAAWLWDLLWDNRSVTDVSVVGRGGTTRRGVVLHRPSRLCPEDRVVRDGIPCTSVARALLEVAATAPSLLRRAYEEAERRRVLDLRDVERVIDAHPRHRGRGPLAALVEDARGPVPMTRSDLERAFLDLVRGEGLPMPAMNATVLGKYEVDALWLDRRVIVEIDHYATHGHRTAFERDRIRDTELQIADFRIGRVTDRQLTKPAETGPRLRRLLEV